MLQYLGNILRLRCFRLAVFVGLFFLSPLVKADEWNENYDQALAALRRGEWQRAIESLQIAVSLRPISDHQATTSNLRPVEYLPYYYLAQAYLFSGEYQMAADNFRIAEIQGAVLHTDHRYQLAKFKKIAQNLQEFSELQSSIEAQARDLVSDDQIARLQDLIASGEFARARKVLADLRSSHPKDLRLSAYDKWLESEIRQKRQSQKTASGIQEKFNSGLNYFVSGQYPQALAQFQAIEKLDPNFTAASDWAQRTRAEIDRLNLQEDVNPQPIAGPEVIEKTIERTSAPVFAIRAPLKAVTEVHSAFVQVSGQVGDDQGIEKIALFKNGKAVLNAAGEQFFIRPQADGDPSNFSFSTRIPVKMGENQIALIAYDIDSTRHETRQLFTVIRKQPFYRTTAAAIVAAAVALLAALVIVITKRIKYRIAIVNKYNPYVAGSPIRNEEMFFGRETLLRRILNTVHNNSLMLYGPRRIGKTSIQHQLKQRLEKLHDPEFNFVPVLIDLQGTPEELFFATLMEEILEACRSQLNGAAPLHLDAKNAPYSARDFSRDLKKLLQTLKQQSEKKLKLVLLMDEVDELNKYSPQVNQKLRSVFMKSFAENLVAVMSGAYISKDWESEGSPWYNFFEEIEVPPLPKEDAVTLIRKPVAGIFSYEEAAIEKIIEYSECKPYIIQRFCINSINRIIEAKRRKVTVADVEAVRRHVFDRHG
ncbi:MAG: ATP-binding protein [bacterium]